MAAGSTYTPIATTTLGSAASSYTFTGISSAYTDLILVATTPPSAGGSVNLTMGNGSIDTGTNYSWTYLRGNGTAASSSRGSTDSRIFSGENATAGLQSNLIIHFQNYSNTTTYKTCISRYNCTDTVTQATVGLWRSTSAINQIRLAIGGDSFAAGATFTLYGIAAA